MNTVHGGGPTFPFIPQPASLGWDTSITEQQVRAYEKKFKIRWSQITDLPMGIKGVPVPFYSVDEFGLVGDGGWSDQITATESSRIITSGRSPWGSAKAGMGITVKGAGPGGSVLVTKIAHVNSDSEIVLDSFVSTTVSGGWAVWGTDNAENFASMMEGIEEFPSVGHTQYGPEIRFDARGVYYTSEPWTIDKLVSVRGGGAVVGGEIVVGNVFPVNISDLTVVCSPAVGWHIWRLQGATLANIRAIGCQSHGFHIGNGGFSTNYGTLYSPMARANGGHGIFLDGTDDAVNANKLYSPVCRENAGYGIYADSGVGGGGMDYNDIFSAQIEGNALGSMKVIGGNDWSVYGGHFVDSDGDGLVLTFTGSRNKLFGGRVVGASSVVSGLAYFGTSFSSGGMRSSLSGVDTLAMVGGASVTAGGGSPEGSVVAPPGSIHMRTVGGAGRATYMKVSGTDENGWAPLLPRLSGNSAGRPTEGLGGGVCYFDTTLGKPIWWDGEKWVDATGAAADGE